MSAPYDSDDLVTLHHGDCREVLAALPDRSVAAVVTDPPYAERTHKMAKSNRGSRYARRAVTFEAITDAELWAVLAECGRVTRGWVVATLDYHHAFRLEENPPDGLACLRIGVWTKPNPMPQPSGDRPGQGWESIAFLHRTDTKPKWSGGGRSSVWHHRVVQAGRHATEKPLAMVGDWVRLFTQPGEVVLDPFAGSGTTLVAAVENSRRAIGVELDDGHCATIRRRLSRSTLELDFTGEAS